MPGDNAEWSVVPGDDYSGDPDYTEADAMQHSWNDVYGNCYFEAP